jgi:AcrR family transcriptional regulator
MEPTAERKRIRPRAKRAGAFHHGDLREALIHAAARAVEKHGHPEVSLRPLADQLGVTQPAVYRHFKSKGELLNEVAMRSWRQLEAALVAALQEHDEPLDAARASARAYVRWAHAHPHRFRLLSSRVPAEQRKAPLPPLPREHYYEGLGRAVPIDEPMLANAFRAAWALAHGLATFVVEHVFMLVDTDEARLAAADGAIDCFIEMMRAKWPPSPRRR